MKRIRPLRATFIIAVGLLATVVPAFAQAEPAKKTGETVEQTLTKLHRELMDAAVRKDKAFEDRVQLDNYVFVNPGGYVEEKGKTTGPGLTFESIDTDDVRVWVHGDTAVLTGRATVKGRGPNGGDVSGTYRGMRVFVKQKGAWRLAATSAVVIEPPRPKPSEVSKPK